MKIVHLAALATLLASLETSLAAQFASEDARLRPSDMLQAGEYGQAVAIDGDVTVIGARGDGEQASLAGAVYVQELIGGAWTPQQKIFASDAAALDWFGHDVALDGDRLLVASPFDDDLGLNSGSVYVFERQPGGQFAEVAKLNASDGDAQDGFGRSVALDGDRVVVGADLADGAVTASGSAYVFERQTNGSWLEVAKLMASDGAWNDRFGVSLDIDGAVVVVGADSADAAGLDSGAAYVFSRGANGTWAEDAKLTGSFADAIDGIGTAIAVDLPWIVVGASSDESPVIETGTALVFERTGTGAIIESDRLLNPGFGSYGASVDVEGGRILVGNPYGGPDADGTAHLYEHLAGTWVETASLLPDARDNATLSNALEYARSVVLDANRVVIGAPNPDFGAGPLLFGRGAAYVLELRPLMHGPTEFSITTGGTQDLLLRAGSAHANRTYLLLGSLSGTSPGTPIPNSNLTLPLNLDLYSRLVLLGGPVSPVVGTLDAFGHADAQFVAPPGLSASFLGARASHAYVVLDSQPPLVSVFVSNAVEVLAGP